MPTTIHACQGLDVDPTLSCPDCLAEYQQHAEGLIQSRIADLLNDGFSYEAAVEKAYHEAEMAGL